MNPLPIPEWSDDGQEEAVRTPSPYANMKISGRKGTRS
jgi:hypothetical protein